MWFSRSRKLGPTNYSSPRHLSWCAVCPCSCFCFVVQSKSLGVSIVGFDVETAPLRTGLPPRCLFYVQRNLYSRRPSHTLLALFLMGRMCLFSPSLRRWSLVYACDSIQGTSESCAPWEIVTQTQGKELTYFRGDKYCKLSPTNRPLNINGDCFLFNTFSLSLKTEINGKVVSLCLPVGCLSNAISTFVRLLNTTLIWVVQQAVGSSMIGRCRIFATSFLMLY